MKLLKEITVRHKKIMEKSILDLNVAYTFHEGEIAKIIDNSFNALAEDQQQQFVEDFPVEAVIDPQTFSNHLAMLSWIMGLVAQKHTTSFTFYVNKCKGLSIPHYTEE